MRHHRTVMLALAFAVTGLGIPAASAAPTVKTKNQAYQTARVCLLQHGARFVGRRGDGGGFAFLKGVPHVQFWTYETTLGLVESVRYYAFDLSSAQKRAFASCVSKGI
jgi:hypothetical protein